MGKREWVRMLNESKSRRRRKVIETKCWIEQAFNTSWNKVLEQTIETKYCNRLLKQTIETKNWNKLLKQTIETKSWNNKSGTLRHSIKKKTLTHTRMSRHKQHKIHGDRHKHPVSDRPMNRWMKQQRHVSFGQHIFLRGKPWSSGGGGKQRFVHMLQRVVFHVW